VKPYAQQLKYLLAGAKGLEEVISRGFVPDVKGARKEVLWTLDRFKKSLTQGVEGNSMKAGPKRFERRKGSGMSKGFDNCRQIFGRDWDRTNKRGPPEIIGKDQDSWSSWPSL
jgi:hypothetical protein